MRFNMRVRNTEKVVMELHSIGELVVDNARKVMQARAKDIVEEARLNAPVDEHNLEESIHIEKSYGYRGRLEITITAGGVVNDVNVDDYAALMHESSYNLGPKSRAKQEANPDRVIGPKFLERAAETVEETLAAKMIAAIRRVVPK